jgi:hypothetical protein
MRDYKRLPEAHPCAALRPLLQARRGWAGAVPGDPALAPAFAEFLREHPDVELEDRARKLMDELQDDHDRAAETVALSHPEDADLDGLALGGDLHPFQRAGVRYALSRRRTFIADGRPGDRHGRLARRRGPCTRHPVRTRSHRGLASPRRGPRSIAGRPESR